MDGFMQKVKSSRAWRFVYSIGLDTIKVDIFKDAYAMAYVTLLSLIPSLAAIFSLVGLFTPIFGMNSSLLKGAEALILKHLATGSGQAVIDQMQGFLANTDLKKIGVTGLIGTLVTLTLLLKQIEETFNRIFEVRVQRPIFQRFLYFWTVLTLGTFCVGIAVGTISNFSWGSHYLQLTTSQQLVRDGAYLGSIFALFVFIYKFAPNRHIPFAPVLIGALFGSTLLIQAIRFFSLYVSNFTRYQAIYGALSALPIFLLWLYVVWFIILLGALLTKRLVDGMPKGSFDPNLIDKEVKPEYFDVVLPLLVLLKTYDAYDNAERCTAPRIGTELHVNASTVQKALEQLEAAGFVVCQHNEHKKAGTLEFYPRLPRNKLSFATLRSGLLGNAEPWIRSIQFAPSETYSALRYQAALNAYIEGSSETLESLVTENDPKALAH